MPYTKKAGIAHQLPQASQATPPLATSSTSHGPKLANPAASLRIINFFSALRSMRQANHCASTRSSIPESSSAMAGETAVTKHSSWTRCPSKSSDAGLTDAANQMIGFFKLDHLAAEPAGGLSYGQQKLLDAAMAFMGGPRLVLLDEPAGGVNLTMLGDLKARLAEINRERKATFVVIEHNMEFVMSLCSRVVVMAEGKVLAIGTPAEIRANSAVIDAYLGH